MENSSEDEGLRRNPKIQNTQDEKLAGQFQKLVTHEETSWAQSATLGMQVELGSVSQLNF